MITNNNYSIEHINKICNKRKVDKSILERNIYALGLLEALASVGMKFIFKGGTSLTLLLETPKRLSTDIDIIVEPGTDVDKYVVAASKIFPFKGVSQQIRFGKNNIEKRHYQFVYNSLVFKRDFHILLDVLFENNNYAKLINKPISNMLIETVEPYLMVTMPSIDCIMGDKLTAFAPHTTGIPFGIDKELEIIKQMYDISCLFDVFENYDDLYNSYIKTVETEITYRGGKISAADALVDTIDTAASIASRGQFGDEYEFLLNGIRKISTHIFDESFTAELAIKRACKVMYAATCILTNTKLKIITDIDKYHDANISKSKYKKLGKIRNLEPVGFAYAVESIALLTNYKDEVI